MKAKPPKPRGGSPRTAPKPIGGSPRSGGRAGPEGRSAIQNGRGPQSAKPIGDVLVKGPIKSKTVLPVLVLHLLAARSDHGCGLMARIQTLCEGLLAVNSNTIYPLLRRLEERGFIVGEWEHPTKRSRRTYRVTAAGIARLERIKTGMLPYLETIAASVQRLRNELYAA